MKDPVVIYVPASREWYRGLNKGLTPERSEAGIYPRRVAESLVGVDAQVELQPVESLRTYCSGDGK